MEFPAGLKISGDRFRGYRPLQGNSLAGINLIINKLRLARDPLFIPEPTNGL